MSWPAWAWRPWRGVPQRRRSRRCRQGRRARPAVPLLVRGARRAHRPADGLGRAPRPGAVPRLADLRGLPPRRGPPPDRRGGRAERLLGLWDRASCATTSRHAAAPSSNSTLRRSPRRVRRARRASRDRPPAAGRPPGAGDVDRQVRPPRPAPRRDHDRCSGRAAGVRRMGDAAGRRRRRDPVPALPARAPQPARRTSRDGPPRAAGRSALLRRLRGLRHDRRPRRRAALTATPWPARRRSKAPAGRSGSPARRASASGSGRGRRSRSSIEIRRSPIASACSGHSTTSSRHQCRCSDGVREIPVRQRVAERPPGADPELGEHLLQMPFDRAGADEQLGADLADWCGRRGRAGRSAPPAA